METVKTVDKHNVAGGVATATHVAHCIFSMQTGGAETMLVDIINGQVKRGTKVSLIIINDLIEESLVAKLSEKVAVVRMNRKPGSNPLMLAWRLNRCLSKIRPDIIHVHNHKLCLLVRWHRTRLLMTVHDMNIPMKYTRNVRMVAITNAVEEYVRNARPGAKVTTVLNGIRTTDISTRDTHGYAGRSFKLVQVARLDTRKKGQDTLIEAVSILKKRGVKVETTLIGDGPDRESLMGLAHKLDVGSSIHFAGQRGREYIYSHLREFDAMCHPSRWEGFGLTIAESMAAGLPLIVTEGDGPWEVADKGRLCVSFPKDDAEKCADAIEMVMDDYDTALHRAAEGREFVKCYDISNTVDNYLKLYGEMTAKQEG